MSSSRVISIGLVPVLVDKEEQRPVYIYMDWSYVYWYNNYKFHKTITNFIKPCHILTCLFYQLIQGWTSRPTDRKLTGTGFGIPPSHLTLTPIWKVAFTIGIKWFWRCVIKALMYAASSNYGKGPSTTRVQFCSYWIFLWTQQNTYWLRNNINLK